MNKYFCEFLATFALVFAGTGAIVINDQSGGVITHIGIALTFGMVVMAMIYAFGDVSGQLQHLWIYVTTLFIGAILVILSCRIVRKEGYCVQDDNG